jgi:hypothetical protein
VITRIRFLFRKLAILLGVLFVLTGCMTNYIYRDVVEPIHVEDPSDLPESLSNQRILFFTSQMVYITTHYSLK